MTPEDKTELKLEIGKIPQILLDNTDRNRTSPFAFTGNKFEFRAVGSTANCANAMIVVNTIVANQLNKFKVEVDKRIAGGIKKDEAILKEIQKLIKESKSIRFEGNGYGEEWVKAAKKRGLSNLKDTPSALKVWKNNKVQDIFSKLNVLSNEEVDARYEVQLDNYVLKLQIEARVCGDMAQNHVIPAAINYQNKLIENVSGLKDIFGAAYKKSAATQIKLIEDISVHLTGLKVAIDELKSVRKKIEGMSDLEKQAAAFSERVRPMMDAVREHADRLEMLVDDEIWPLPKLREILFTR